MTTRPKIGREIESDNESGRSRPDHVSRRFVLAFTQIDDVPEQTVRSPLNVADLDDHFRAHPMAREHER